MTEFEAHITRIARAFPYPDPPKPALALRTPRTGWLRYGMVAAVILIATVVAIPPVRAAVLDFLRIGAVELRLNEPADLESALPMDLDALYGQTSLEAAADEVHFQIRLPEGYGSPDRVYLQTYNDGAMLITAWDEHEDRPAITLFHFDVSAYIPKGFVNLNVIEQTEVRGNTAVWTDTPHTVQFLRENEVVDAQQLLVEGSVLIWVSPNVTYRLEGASSLEQALQIAYSVH